MKRETKWTITRLFKPRDLGDRLGRTARAVPPAPVLTYSHRDESGWHLARFRASRARVRALRLKHKLAAARLRALHTKGPGSCD